MTNTEKIKFRNGDTVAVHVFAPIDTAFDYTTTIELQVGDLVEVPFGSKTRKGVVWGEGATREGLKAVEKRLNFPPMRTELRKFVMRMAEYTITPIGQILPMLYRTQEPLEPKPNAVRAIREFEGSLSPKRQALFDALNEVEYLFLDQVGASRTILKGLIEQGGAETFIARRARTDCKISREVSLTEAQTEALHKILNSTQPILLKGVTGSGKTEVYLEAIKDILDSDQQALIMLPEIALTSAFLDRFEERFGFRAGHWHSDMSMADRRRIWHGVSDGSIPVVIGARSSLFLPFQSLNLIVVDEEHDRGYKQEEGVIYSGRDMAVLRAHIEKSTLVLASATPSIETMVNATAGRYLRVDLAERFGHAVLPEMRTVDMREAGLDANHWLSPVVQRAIQERIEIGEQSLLFLNRRGFAPLTLCRACGHQIACPNCDARLVEHVARRGLHCHQCGYQTPIPKTCPSCEAEDKLVPIGPGVERLAREVENYFPDARICVLSSDTTNTEDELRAQISAIERGEYDVIVGTQMVAKGHNFPQLTLVGIVDADIGLEGGDLRASEQSFQVLRQVSGRAGRFEKSGLALVQSYQPDHPILRAILSEDDHRFYDEEIERRKLAFAPPFSRYIAIIIWANEFDEAMQTGRKLLNNADHAFREKQILVWGPTPAPIARIRNRVRVRMLLKLPKNLALHKDVRNWVEGVKAPKRVKIQIDVDPQSFL